MLTRANGCDEESKDTIADEIAEMAEEAQGLFSMQVLADKDFNSLLHKQACKGLVGL